MIRIGVLGCGYFGAEFARAVKEMKGDSAGGSLQSRKEFGAVKQ